MDKYTAAGSGMLHLEKCSPDNNQLERTLAQAWWYNILVLWEPTLNQQEMILITIFHSHWQKEQIKNIMEM
jgi:hypothetical protein